MTIGRRQPLPRPVHSWWIKQARPVLQRAFGQPNGESPIQILVACSGGSDSVALARALSAALRWDPSWKRVEMVLVYIHHGPSVRAELQAARDRAAALVRELAQRLECRVLIKHVRPAQASEAGWREARLDAFKELTEQFGARAVLLAHHRDDAAETRLIRLLRGTSKHGLRAIRPVARRQNGLVLVRPFLGLWRRDVEMMAQALDDGARDLVCDDPSNQDTRHLRNWLRVSWRAPLDQARPGAWQALARSLERLARKSRRTPTSVLTAGSPEQRVLVLKRSSFQLASGVEELAEGLRQAAQDRGWSWASITEPQAREVLRRLDSPRRRLSFRVGTLQFQADGDWLEVWPV